MWYLLACAHPSAVPAPLHGHGRLTLLAINDFHGGLYEAPVRGEEDVRYGGLPWLAAAVGEVRGEARDVLLLDGGDAFQGAWPVNATKGLGAVDASELLGVDAAAVGNHEFDYGGGEDRRDALEVAAAEAAYPYLTANVREADGSRWAPANVLPWTVIERAGLRIGVVGLTTATTPSATNPNNVAGLTFVDPVEAVRELLPELEDAKLDLTVLVGHLTGECRPTAYAESDDPCTPDGEVGRLLTDLPPGTFDVMVLGHAHTVMHHRVGDTILLEGRTGGHLLGRVDLVVRGGGIDFDKTLIHDPWPIRHAPLEVPCGGEGRLTATEAEIGGVELQADADAIALLDRLEGEVGSLCEELTCASRDLFRDRVGESALGDWLADGLRSAFPEADLGVQNAGGIRADLPKGPVRREAIQKIAPFDNKALLVQLTGAQVHEMLRIGARAPHGVLQVSGASYTFDKTNDRVCDVQVGGRPLDERALYEVATSDFLYEGGDGLAPVFAGARIVDEGPLLRDVFATYAAATEGCVGDAPASEARITAGVCR